MMHTLRGPIPTPRRRIAIVEIPRLGRARLGMIGDAQTPNSSVVGWTTISDQVPSNSDNWMAFILQAQAQRRETKAGTLTYTPAPNAVPPPVQAPWNSWGLTSCNQDGTPISDPVATMPAAPAATENPIFMGAALLTAFAAAVYLLKGGK